MEELSIWRIAHVSYLIPQDDDRKGQSYRLALISADEKILGSSVEILMSWCTIYMSAVYRERQVKVGNIFGSVFWQLTVAPGAGSPKRS
jgi:hypothetical protein